VEVSEAAIAGIPVGNLRVPRAEFAAVWAAAEQVCAQQAAGAADWYAAGVAMTCEWIAGAVVETTTGRAHLARAPVTGHETLAYEELIEAEYLAAGRLDLRRPRPAWLLRRPGFTEGICATLRWAWRHDGPPPLRLTGQPLSC
jgi:hypothetical protein